jgi:hypothetical protein
MVAAEVFDPPSNRDEFGEGSSRGWSRLVAREGNERSSMNMSLSAKNECVIRRRIDRSTAAEEEDDG